MSKGAFTASDLRGLSKLGFDAALGVTDLVEQMHHTIARGPPLFGEAIEGPARGVAGLVYRGVRGAIRLTGEGADALLRMFEGRESAESSPGRDIALAALNGVIGDRLAATDNPLALTMRLRSNGRALDLNRAALADFFPRATGRVVVLVHGGLRMSDLHWRRKDHDHGASLENDLEFTPVYLFYNRGLHVSESGRAFADLLEALIRAWPVPVEELVILGHSMGGLVAQRLFLRRARRMRMATLFAKARLSRNAASRSGARAHRRVGRRRHRSDSLHGCVQSLGPPAQRGRHRPSPRRAGRRGLAGPRPLRPRKRHPNDHSFAHGCRMLCGRRNHGEDIGRRPRSNGRRWARHGRQRARRP